MITPKQLVAHLTESMREEPDKWRQSTGWIYLKESDPEIGVYVKDGVVYLNNNSIGLSWWTRRKIAKVAQQLLLEKVNKSLDTVMHTLPRRKHQ